MLLRKLPYSEKMKLCDILDNNNCFKELGVVHMQFEEETLQKLLRESNKSGSSTTERLIDAWDNYGHTVLELFILLKRMQQFEAMKVLRPFVEQKFHYLIKEIPVTPKIKSEKILNGPVVQEVQRLAITETRDDNETSNMLQHQNNLLNLPKPKSPIIPKTNGTGITPSDASSVMENAGMIPVIPYDELQKSTNNWDQSHILGKGGFGIVFKGTWKNTEVAIKRIEKKEDSPESSYQQIMQSNTELHCLNAYRHDNILPLYGYSIGGPQPCLVYQFMSGGSLEHRLYTRDLSKVLTWPLRLSIAIGTARGLQFLHTIRTKPLIHGDIKSANILLDRSDIPRIGDFGLAREGPQSDYIKVTRIHGTRPYLPVEFMKEKKFSTKVDTYSFGVVLFEIATGSSAYSDRRKKKFLSEYVVTYDEEKILEIKDPRAPEGESCFKRLINIGKMCVRVSAKSRPEMVEVLKMLESDMVQ